MAFPKSRQQKITILNKNLNGEWLCLKVGNKKITILNKNLAKDVRKTILK